MGSPSMYIAPTGQTFAHLRQEVQEHELAHFSSKIHDYFGVFSSQFEVKCVDAFNLVADSDASCAEYASVAVNNQEVMGGVNWLPWSSCAQT